eukprot:Em0005g210a
MRLSMVSFRFCMSLALLAIAHFGSSFGQSLIQSDAECLYLERLSAKISGPINSSSLPSVNANCIASWNNLLLFGPKNSSIVSLCVNDCQSLHDLYVRCKGKTEADFNFGLLCGQYNGVFCASLYGTSQFATLFNSTEVYCSGNPSASCSSDCKQAAQSFLDYAGCCTDLFSNATYAACGIAPPDFCQPVYVSAATLQVSGGPAALAATTAIVAFAALCATVMART